MPSCIQCATNANAPLPSAFIEFLQRNGICIEAYRRQLGQEIPRFIRINPRSVVDVGQLLRSASYASADGADSSSSSIGSSVDQQQQCNALRCDLADFYAIPARVRLAQTSSYRSADVYGVDLSSGWAVHELDVRPGHAVLDVCAAPGAKLTMIADRMRRRGYVMAVDVSADRLRVCSSILRKYGITLVDLVQGDGATLGSGRGARFDRVLVDAECTHDGSLKHVMKFASWGWHTFERRFLDAARIDSLTRLQRRLLQSGFDALKVGGVLVYSTCSFCERQNEEVVASLLECNPSARLVPVSAALERVSGGSGHGGSGARMPGTARLDPLQSRTSALFIARVTKVL